MSNQCQGEEIGWEIKVHEPQAHLAQWFRSLYSHVQVPDLRPASGSTFHISFNIDPGDSADYLSRWMSSHLLPGPAPATVGIWRVNQYMW